MGRRIYTQDDSGRRSRGALRVIPWKLLLLLPIAIVFILPTYLYASHVGNTVIPSFTGFFYTLTNGSPTSTPMPVPAFPAVLPHFGAVAYTVQEGDSCDEILALQMHMADAGQIFSDVEPQTVNALSETLGHDCHNIHPGIRLLLPPHYPLVAFGGIVRSISSTTPQQALPTPLINVPQDRQDTPDCTGGCLLTVQIGPQTQVHLLVQTGLGIHIGTWIWSRAALTRKAVPHFANYPFVDPNASLNGMSLDACDFQLDNSRDANALTCDQVNPNTIQDDSGSWLFGVTGSSALNHWGYRLRLPNNTPVLLWLTQVNGDLKYLPGSPMYRYDSASQLYVKV